MGKAIKAVQEALLNLRATGPKWVCVQRAKTESFREVCNSFNSLYSLTNCSSKVEEEEEVVVDIIPSPADEGGESFSSTISMTVSSSSLWTESYDSSQTETELATKSSICSKRFFFSPCTTKSIMEEEEVVVAADEAGGIMKQTAAVGAEEGTDDDELQRNSRHGRLPRTESVTMAVASENPYQDFKESMEEMVRAHEIRSWKGLHELLRCYLTLNDHTNHQTILLAFVDLLITLVASQQADVNINNNVTSKQRTLMRSTTLTR